MEAKYFWLLLLVAQNTSKTLILRLAVGAGGKGKFLYSAAVLATEGLKATCSCLWVLRSGGSVGSSRSSHMQQRCNCRNSTGGEVSTRGSAVRQVIDCRIWHNTGGISSCLHNATRTRTTTFARPIGPNHHR